MSTDQNNLAVLLQRMMDRTGEQQLDARNRVHGYLRFMDSAITERQVKNITNPALLRQALSAGAPGKLTQIINARLLQLG